MHQPLALAVAVATATATATLDPGFLPEPEPYSCAHCCASKLRLLISVSYQYRTRNKKQRSEKKNEASKHKKKRQKSDELEAMSFQLIAAPVSTPQAQALGSTPGLGLIGSRFGWVIGAPDGLSAPWPVFGISSSAFIKTNRLKGPETGSLYPVVACHAFVFVFVFVVFVDGIRNSAVTSQHRALFFFLSCMAAGLQTILPVYSDCD